MMVKVGDKFGYWTVLETNTKKDKFGRLFSQCQCRCSKLKDVRNYSLTAGSSSRCQNCINYIDGSTKHKLYRTWIQIRTRCFN